MTTLNREISFKLRVRQKGVFSGEIMFEFRFEGIECVFVRVDEWVVK